MEGTGERPFHLVVILDMAISWTQNLTPSLPCTSFLVVLAAWQIELYVMEARASHTLPSPQWC